MTQQITAPKIQQAWAPPTTPAEIRVVVVDDHTLMRQGLATILEKLCRFTIVGQAGDGPSAIDLVQSARPHVVLMDISLPGMTGVEATRRIVALMPHVKVVALTMHHSDEMRRKMTDAGAVDYLTKSVDASQLCATIRKVAMPS